MLSPGLSQIVVTELAWRFRRGLLKRLAPYNPVKKMLKVEYLKKYIYAIFLDRLLSQGMPSKFGDCFSFGGFENVV